MLSATPIPRTLAMSYLADLDVSVIDELPPGRSPVVTKLVAAARRNELLARIRDEVAQGRQAYWVCPLVEEGDRRNDRRPHGRDDDVRGASPRAAAGTASRSAARPARRARQVRRHGGVRGRDDRRAGGDDGHRGRCRCAERDADGDRACASASAWRSCTSCAAGSAAARDAELLRAALRRSAVGACARASAHHLRDDGRLRGGAARPAYARSRASSSAAGSRACRCYASSTWSAMPSSSKKPASSRNGCCRTILRPPGGTSSVGSAGERNFLDA